MEGSDPLCDAPHAEICPSHGHERLLPEPSQRPGRLPTVGDVLKDEDVMERMKVEMARTWRVERD